MVIGYLNGIRFFGPSQQAGKLTNTTTMIHDLHPTEEQLWHFEGIERQLEIRYGPRLLAPDNDPVSGLVSTILSQNTSDVNTSRSFASLGERFSTWQEVIDANAEDVADAIRMGGLSNLKAPRIQAALQSIINRRGELNLDFLRKMSVDDAMAWLTQLNGIGPKTAACVLLFSLGMPAMPVDTHVGRVMKRLGVLPHRVNPAIQQSILENLIGPDAHRVYAVHVETITHGRQICKSRRPLCEQCFLAPLCRYYQETIND
jgi:endonuclease III